MTLQGSWLRVGVVVLMAVPLSACGGGDEGASPSAEGADGAECEERTLIYASSLPEDSALNAGLQYWASEMEERTDGAVTVEANYSGSLVGAAELLPAVQDGRADMAYVSSAIGPADWPLWSLAGVPFETFDPAAQMWAYQELYEESEPFQQEWEQNGVHNLMELALSPAVTGLNKPISSVDDLQGRRVRMVGYAGAALEAVGMETVALDPGELYESIERGVVDGYGAFPFDIVHTQGLPEVAPHMYDLGIGHYASSAIAMNLELWSSLGSACQELMTEVAKEYMTEEAIPVVTEAEEVACEAILETGATVTVLDEDQQSEIKSRAGDAALDVWANEALASGLDKETLEDFHDQLLEKYADQEADSDYESGLQACAERS